MFSRFLNCTNGAKTSYTFFSDKPNIYKHIHANALEKFAVIHQKVSKDDCQQLFNDENLWKTDEKFCKKTVMKTSQKKRMVEYPS